MHEPGTKLYRRWRRQKKRRTFIAIVVIGIVSLGIWFKPSIFPANTPPKESGQISSKTSKLTKGTPTFKTFVPSGKTIDDYGGWTRVSPSSSEPVYAYNDSFGGTAVIVSQQKLPSSFKSDEKKHIQKLQSDESYTAQHIINIDDLTIYVGVSQKNYQSTIFVKQGILILITSYRSINDTMMAEYAQSLR